jgi:SAM-dependent methyltransferase
MRDIADQYRKPTGLIGRWIARRIERLNLPKYPKLVNGLNITDTDYILEIGFGSGLALKLIGERNPHCQLEGIDFSELMVDKATKINKKLIITGRLKLFLGDFLSTDLPRSGYSKVFCINVIYFWETLGIPFQKIFNLLQEGGIFGIYMTRSEDIIKVDYARSPIFHKYSEEEVTAQLQAVGFSDINVVHDKVKVGIGLYIYAKK